MLTLKKVNIKFSSSEINEKRMKGLQDCFFLQVIRV
uniref:Uncharacterized protein n=1 Tax=Rhizophora mucronata TaxID=61149 RepID=A0A2P2N5H0_RHIMU